VTYIVQADLEARISAEALRQILDDDMDGTPDANALTRVIADSESYVESYLRGNYDLDTIRALGVGVPNEIKRLCLDVATAYLWERFPEYVRADGYKLLQRAKVDLTELRKSDRRLDTTVAPEPPANQTHIVRTGDPDHPNIEGKFFLDPDDFGIF